MDNLNKAITKPRKNIIKQKKSTKLPNKKSNIDNLNDKQPDKINNNIKETDNISVKEIKKFNSYADEWWNPEGAFKILHTIHRLRIDYIIQQISVIFDYNIKDKVVLDIGCGGGLISEDLASRGMQVYGYDLSVDSINIASKHASENHIDNITYQVGCIDDAYKEDKYDVILLLEILEHVGNFTDVVKKACKCLKPGGVIIISTINRTFNSLITAKFMAEYVLRWVPKGTHDWNLFIKPSQITSSFKDVGVVDISGMSYDLFKRKWYISKNLQVNYFITGRKY